MGKEDYPADWEKRRSKVLERDDYECQECDTDLVAADTQAHVHHIRPISEGGGHSYGNLETLCRECHINEHSHGKPKDPVDVYECAVCEGGYTRSNGWNRSYCSKVCYSRHEARKFLADFHSNASICSSCARPFGDGSVCKNCGNWERESDMMEPEVDKVRLVAYAFRCWKWGESWTNHNT
jgi:hypothetical protein